MAGNVTVEQVERLAAELAPSEQLQLAARVCERLAATQATSDEPEDARRARLAQVDAWLAECDAVAETIPGEFDAAEDLRRIRDERADRL